MGLIDFHAHLAPNEDALSGLLASMDANEISEAIVVAGSVLPPSQLSLHLAKGGGENITVDNHAIQSLCRSTNGRLFPFYFANPYDSVDEYRSIGTDFYGLKLAAIVHGVPLDDEHNQKFLEVARGFGHPVYLHCLPREGFDVEAFRRLAEVFPDVAVVLGHGGVNTCDFYAVDAVADLPNVYFETSGPFISVVRYAAKVLGPERILFGSEYPLQSARVEIEKIRASGLSFETLNANARRLVRVPHA